MAETSHVEDPKNATECVDPSVGDESAGGVDQKKTPTPSQRVKDHLLEAKRKRLEKEQAGIQETPAHDSTPEAAETGVKEGKEVKGSKVELKSTLLAKPKDWGLMAPVTAEQQQPSKPRGRKPRSKKDEGDKESNTKKQQPKRKSSKAKAKEAAVDETKDKPKRRRRPAKAAIPTAYEPLPAEGDKNLDKGAAFDAYASACCAASVHELNGNEENTKEQANGKTASKSKRNRKNKQSVDSTGAKGRSRKAKKDNTPKGRSRKAKKVNTPKGRSRKAPNKPSTTDEGKSSKSTKTPEAKARYSRKSCAYKKALKAAQAEGKSLEDAKAAAKKVPYLILAYHFQT